MNIVDLHPALGLSLTAGPLQLRGITDDDLVQLCALAERGVHPPEQMPFCVPWTAAPAGELAANVAAHHWRNRADFAVTSWHLALGVWYDGEIMGCQGLRTRDFLVTRTGETGSWLGISHQGRGIGTRMRQAVCAFAFDHLDAVEVRSGAFVDNPASIAVSRKVGYREDGCERLQRRPGEVAVNQRLALTPETFLRDEHPLEVEGLAAFRRFVGLDADPLR